MMSKKVGELKAILHDANITDYNSTVLESIIEDSKKAKQGIRALLEKTENWNADEDKTYIEVEVQHEADYYEAGRIYCDIRGLFYYKLTLTESNILSDMYYHFSSGTVSPSMASLFERLDIKGCKVGVKLTRAIGKLVEHFEKKYPLDDEHIKQKNQLLARFGDAFIGRKEKIKVYYSINVNDFMTMSKGNSWGSCHDIGFTNVGCHCSGTVSYALDNVTLIAYSIGNKVNEILTDKNFRQCLMLGRNHILQSRPYGNCPQVYQDGITSGLIEVLNKQDFYFEKMEEMNNNTFYNIFETRNDATCYPDYNYYENRTLYASLTDAVLNDNDGLIGQLPVCLNCGDEFYNSESMFCNEHDNQHSHCADCGDIIDTDDAYYVDGDYYCSYCVTYCDCCNEYIRNRDITDISSGRYTDHICSDCLDRNYFECENCGDWTLNDDGNSTDDGQYLCENCYEEWQDENNDDDEENDTEVIEIIKNPIENSYQFQVGDRLIGNGKNHYCVTCFGATVEVVEILENDYIMVKRLNGDDRTAYQVEARYFDKL
jgi:hypothetical protein